MQLQNSQSALQAFSPTCATILHNTAVFQRQLTEMLQTYVFDKSGLKIQKTNSLTL